MTVNNVYCRFLAHAHRAISVPGKPSSTGPRHVVDRHRVMGDHDDLLQGLSAALHSLGQPRLHFPEGEVVVRLVDEQRYAAVRGEMDQAVQRDQRALTVGELIEAVPDRLVRGASEDGLEGAGVLA